MAEATITVNPGFEYGNSSGKWVYYFTGNFLHNDIGIENPTGGSRPIHDDTNQNYRGSDRSPIS